MLARRLLLIAALVGSVAAIGAVAYELLWHNPDPNSSSAAASPSEERGRTAGEAKGEPIPGEGQPPPSGGNDARRFPALPRSESSYLNTRPNVKYVGSNRCTSCHEEHTASFRATGMGRSSAVVDVNREPADGEYRHAISGRRYESLRKGEQLWHREILSAAPGSEEIVLQEHPLRYVVGSGRHSLTYVAEIDGFFVESPITWYASRKAWEMSPGYNVPDHDSFQRAVGEGCLICHMGAVEPTGDALHRVRVLEEAIGCERCHGPGELHVEKWSSLSAPQANKVAARAPREAGDDHLDDTIVNPAHLQRDLAEAICQQCHLRTSAAVLTRGRRLSDFRPGLPLVDFRQDYQLVTSDAAMKVVGHVEQLHLSKCYQASDDLSCLTCHNPHDASEQAGKVAAYRSACLSCHSADACGVAAEDPRRRNEEDNCVACHMPQSPTQIVHLAFTHHRIGVHAAQPDSGSPPVETAAAPDSSLTKAPSQRAMLKPFFDLSRFSAWDRGRSLGLAYLEAANLATDPATADECRRQAWRQLLQVQSTGPTDGEIDAAIARLRAELGLGDVEEAARKALDSGDLSSHDRCNTLFLWAEALAQQGRYLQAAAALSELTRLRRSAADWLLLADCQRAIGREDYVDSLSMAVRIDPGLKPAHAFLAEHYRSRKDTERAHWHKQRAQ